MKITFLRYGHANNSSSSHSIIFTNHKMSDTAGDLQFGWNDFVLASTDNKKAYLLTTLKTCWEAAININTYVEEFYISRSSLKNCLDQAFQLFVAKHAAKLVDAFEVIESVSGNNYVDHQSQPYFPLNRATGLLDMQFFNDFANEFLKSEYKLLGGNDNEDSSLEKPEDCIESNQFIDVFRFIRDTGAGVTSCMKDTLTGEWVLSRKNGPIMKVLF